MVQYDQKQGKGLTTAGAVVAGAVVGATAGAVLANETSRKKVIKAISQLRDRAIKTANTDEIAPRARKKVAKIVSKAAKRAKVN